MARTIVEDYREGDFTRLFFALKLERIVSGYEGDDANWHALMTKALRCLQIKDYAELRRTITEIDDYYCD